MPDSPLTGGDFTPDSAARFAAAWDAFARGGEGEPPSLASVLRVQDPFPDRELLELVVLDASRRWRHGLPARLEHYQSVLPGMAPESEVAAAIVRLELEHDPAAESTDGIEALRRRIGTRWRPAFEAAAEEIAGGEGVSSGEDADARADWFGDYEVQSELGEGGFGYVYLGVRRKPFRQKVAIKVLKRGMDSQRVLARFEAERQALAQMDHPGIARIYDAGMSGLGLPYFVMEYVRGEPITEYCDRHRLSTRARLELFRQVCEGVQHAHQRGVIHRDIKPTNVLVSVVFDRAHVKIIDFGVAKAIESKLSEETIFTEQGQIIGTPEYMSPEQADMGSLDIDTRTDVYSLGVLLYELLTGVRPFDLRRRALMEIQRIIREEDPPRPSTQLSSLGESATDIARQRATSLAALRGELQRELEWIPLKALRKDRTQRYRTPMDMADDIGNYLAGRALEAGPESGWYRARKFARRHTGAIAIAGAGVLAGMIAIGGLAWGLRQQTRMNEAITAQREQARAVSIDLLASVESAWDAIERVVAAEGLEGQSPGLLRASLDQWATDLSQREIEPVFRVGLSRSLGESYMRLGLLRDAEAHLRAAVDLGRATLGAELSLALAQVLLTECLMRQNRADEASDVRRAAEGTLGLLETEHARVVSRELRSSLAAITKRQGQTERDDDQRRRRLLEDARAQYESVVDDYAATGESRTMDGLIAQYDLALVESLLGEHESAIERISRVRSIYESERGREFSSWVNATAELGLMHASLGGRARKAGDEEEAGSRFERAAGLYLEAIDVGERALGNGHWRVTQTYLRLGNLYIAMRRHAEAVEAFDEAFARYRVVEGEYGGNAAYAVRRRAVALVRAGRAEEGVSSVVGYFERAERSGRVSREMLASLCESVVEVMEAADEGTDSEAWRLRARAYRGDEPQTAP